jgi:hypothetical protein
MNDFPPAEWDVVCSNEQLQRLRTHVGFQRLVALSRLANQLRFAQLVLPGVQGDDSPSGKRQRINSFFLTAALLHEGMQLAQRLAQFHRDRPSFQAGFSEILRSAEFRDLISNYIKRLRNQAVFHVDDEEIEELLGRYSADPTVFVSGSGRMAGATYYDLGDIVAMMTFVGPVSSHEEFMERSKDLMRRTTALAIAFVTAADKLIADLLPEYGFRPRDTDRRV